VGTPLVFRKPPGLNRVAVQIAIDRLILVERFPELTRKHPGRWVVIYNGQVVVADNEATCIKQLGDCGPDALIQSAALDPNGFWPQ